MVDRLDGRLRAEVAEPDVRNRLMTCGYILCGLRYNPEDIAAAFARVTEMRESATYQQILQDGMQQGRLGTARKALLDILAERFADVPPEVEQRVRTEPDPAKLEAAIRQALRVARPADLTL